MQELLANPEFIARAIAISAEAGLEKEVAISFATDKTGPELEDDEFLMAAFDAIVANLGYRRGKVFGIRVEGENNTPRVAGKGTVFAIKQG